MRCLKDASAVRLRSLLRLGRLLVHEVDVCIADVVDGILDATLRPVPKRLSKEPEWCRELDWDKSTEQLSGSPRHADWLVPPDADFRAVIIAFLGRTETVGALDSLAKNSSHSGRLCSSYFRGVRSLTAIADAVAHSVLLLPESLGTQGVRCLGLVWSPQAALQVTLAQCCSLTANTEAVDDPGALVPALDCARA